MVVAKGPTNWTLLDARHELGHLMMHADAAPANPEVERLANRLASGFLVERPQRLSWGHSTS